MVGDDQSSTMCSRKPWSGIVIVACRLDQVLTTNIFGESQRVPWMSSHGNLFACGASDLNDQIV